MNRFEHAINTPYSYLGLNAVNLGHVGQIAVTAEPDCVSAACIRPRLQKRTKDERITSIRRGYPETEMIYRRLISAQHPSFALGLAMDLSVWRTDGCSLLAAFDDDYEQSAATWVSQII